MDNTSAIHRVRDFLRSLFWFLSPWLALAGGAAILVPLTTQMPGRSHEGPLPPLTDAELAVQERLRTHVSELAGRIGERNMRRYHALEEAARYIEGQLRSAGYSVASETYRVEGRPVRNLIAFLEGAGGRDEVVVLGAHYDSYWGSPGANDNATGVAALLEIARGFASAAPPGRSIRFVAFVNEEPPYFKTRHMGSLVHATQGRGQEEKIIAMLSLETIGYYSDAPNSQFFPYHLGLFYPWTGNFLGFVANRESRDLLLRAITVFRRHTPFPSEGLSAPAWITGVDWSDHWSFWEQGIPALMVTDTAPYRYPHYHTSEDTPDKVDFYGLTRVTLGLAQVLRALSEQEPTTP